MPTYEKQPEIAIRMDPRLAERLAEKKARLDLQRPLHPSIAQRLHEDLRVRLTFHSNAIEGNTLSLRETQIVVEEGITIGGHSLREHLEATNHAGAFDLLRQLVGSSTPVNIEAILALHALVLKTIDPTAGQFRTSPVYIRGSDLTPPPARHVPQLMREWIRWLEDEGLTYPPVIRAVIAHHGFVAVHPFIDGNGRTGRLLLNLLLMREGYPPAFLLRSWAERYRNALSAADHGRYNPIVNLIGQAVEAGLDFYLGACAAVPEENYVPLPELARTRGRDANYLGLLVRQGKLEAVKRGSRWYATPSALDHYEAEVQAGRFQRGRPPKQH